MNAYSKTTGKQIVGTLELVPGVAQLDEDSFQRVDGKLDYSHAGYTDLDWDAESAVFEDKVRLFVDEDGNSVPETDIELRPSLIRYARLMQFVAGPQTQTFYACETHVGELRRGEVACFLPITGENVRRVENDESSCDFCREG